VLSKLCQQIFASASTTTLRHTGGAYRRVNRMRRPDGIYQSQSACNNQLYTFEIDTSESYSDVNEFLQVKKQMLKFIIKEQITFQGAIKSNLFLECEMINAVGEIQLSNYKTANAALYHASDINVHLKKSFAKIVCEIEERSGKESDSSLHEIKNLELRTNKFVSLCGSSYLRLPKDIENTKSFTNVPNNDNECFKWSVLASFTKNHPQYVDNLTQYEDRYNWDMIDFPTPLNKIKYFERVNNISINVFALDEENKVFSLKVCDEELEDHRDLLLIQHEETTHYCLITNFDRLVHPQLPGLSHKKYICKRCLTHHYSDEALKNHKEYGLEQTVAKIDMPKESNGEVPQVYFKNYKNMIKLLFIIYEDFEAILRDGTGGTKSSKVYQHHEPMSFAVFVKSTFPPEHCGEVPLEPYIYCGPNAAEHFIKYLSDVAAKVDAVYYRNIDIIPLTKAEWESHARAEVCYLCEQSLTADNVKVRDHNHLTGKNKGAAQMKCNLNVKNPRVIPVCFHKLSGYDSHIIVPHLGDVKGAVKIIPHTKEKYITFAKKIGNTRFQFVDTFRFMNKPLETLSKILLMEKNVLTGKFFQPEHLSLIT
jgi:hypothetical protein